MFGVDLDRISYKINLSHLRDLFPDESKNNTIVGSWSENYADPVRVLSGLITQARTTKMKEALMTMIQELMNKAGTWRSIQGNEGREYRIVLTQEDIE